jgi:flagellar biosynthesis GTPase FlhF
MLMDQLHQLLNKMLLIKKIKKSKMREEKKKNSQQELRIKPQEEHKEPQDQQDQQAHQEQKQQDQQAQPVKQEEALLELLMQELLKYHMELLLSLQALKHQLNKDREQQTTQPSTLMLMAQPHQSSILQLNKLTKMKMLIMKMLIMKMLNLVF